MIILINHIDLHKLIKQLIAALQCLSSCMVHSNNLILSIFYVIFHREMLKKLIQEDFIYTILHT